jgi:hypothetical protein
MAVRPNGRIIFPEYLEIFFNYSRFRPFLAKTPPFDGTIAPFDDTVRIFRVL